MEWAAWLIAGVLGLFLLYGPVLSWSIMVPIVLLALASLIGGILLRKKRQATEKLGSE